MDPHTWFAFFVASWIIAVSPGSGAVLSMSHGLSYGVRKTSATIMGLQLGLLLILLIAGAGVGSLLMASELAFNAVKIVGAGYLIYLGISQWRSGGSPLAAQEAVPEASLKKRVLMGFLTNATNPKGIIFMVAVLPQFMTTSRPLAPQLAILAVTMLAVDTTVMHGYAAGASALRGLMRSARAMRNQNRVFGGLLMAVGTGLFFVQRSSEA
ncbi:LysE family transporter [Comamonas thiooxydans]|uniref:LysE family transporter n=1 Tax=Comamonas thiooxydans TaxID=363952 RepID=UPI0005107746|nr:LysE family transporter [Comamonas thiooxydans]KGG89711.1 lysine transporter LysE [Comamonas thiooxydans]